MNKGELLPAEAKEHCPSEEYVDEQCIQELNELHNRCTESSECEGLSVGAPFRTEKLETDVSDIGMGVGAPFPYPSQE